MPRKKISKPVPIWDQNITSQFQREKKRFKLSMNFLDEEDVTEEYIADMAKNLVGESRDTWGIQVYNPSKGDTGKKPTNGFKATEERWLGMMGDMQSMAHAHISIIPNSPSNSPILRAPLEVREEIYSYLLLYPNPIMVKRDWKGVERNRFIDHSVILVCKQFSIEASAFLYKNNTFRALLRNQALTVRRFEAPAAIAREYLSNIRNLIVDCSRDCWDLGWHEKTARSLTPLVSARAVVKSLTIVMYPQRVGMSTTALGVEANPISFADFLWYYGTLMMAIRMLAPGILKIVIKKDGMRRLDMEVDMRYLQAGQLEEGPLVNRETIRLREANIEKVEYQLKTLKARFEHAFEDDQSAIAEGICTLLADSKDVTTQHSDLASQVGGEERSILIG